MVLPLMKKIKERNKPGNAQLFSRCIVENIDLRNEVLSFLSEERKTCRQLSRSLCPSIERSFTKIRFNSSTPKDVILSLVAKMPNLKVILLDGSTHIDDLGVKYIMLKCRLLRYLRLCYCRNLTTNVIAIRHPRVIVNIHGCWRIIGPHPNLTPLGVVELQILALQQNPLDSSEGIQAAFEFTCPEQRKGVQAGNLSSKFLSPGFRDILFSKSFRIQNAVRRGSRCFIFTSIAIQTEGKHLKENHYIWVLSRQTAGKYKNCWMTKKVFGIQTQKSEPQNEFT
mmetsp:Transcript_31091/g.41121  ORF Transcript_31091/g.41121 Transcript_31091/m.41121 type:complete len:282 (+) Transcript_31091:355-1200(+)